MNIVDHVNRAKRGEMASCEYLISKFHGVSISYAYSILHDFQLAEDATQEAFILLLNNISKLKEPSAFSAWLKKLIFTSCNRIQRKRKNEIAIEDIREPINANDDIDFIIEKKEQKSIINIALEQLTKGQQEVFLLYYTFGKSYADISSDLGITEAAVASRLYQGKKKLKNILLPQLTDYLGGYKMDKKLFVRKIIEGIQNPSQPETQQGDGYVACFTSLYMAVENDLSLERKAVYSKFTTVAGLDILTFDHTRTTSFCRVEPEDLAKEYGIDDYVEYTMGYAGYEYERLRKNESDKECVLNHIITSLQKDIPVLMETKNGWCVVTGYDEKGLIYGFDNTNGGRDHRLSSDSIEYWNELFILDNWYDIMDSVVIYVCKKAPTITKRDIFSRLSRIIDDMEERGYDGKLINQLLDGNFDSLTDDEKKVLFMQTLNFLYFHVHTRAMMCWGMSEEFYPDYSDQDMNLRQSINGYMGDSHDFCWGAFRALGKGGFHVDMSDFPNFLNPEKRYKVIDSIRFIALNDYKTSCVCKIIAGEYISDIERFLTEPHYNIPRNQVGPEDMGSFVTENIVVESALVTGRYLSIHECNINSDSDLFILDCTIDQGMYYYNKKVFVGSYADASIVDVDACEKIGGNYLKISGDIPIAIYNIVNSWFDSNGIEIDSDRKMFIRAGINNQFETFIPVCS